MARLERELHLERDANTALNAAMEREVAALDERTRAQQTAFQQQQANLVMKLSEAEKKVSGARRGTARHCAGTEQ